MDYIFTPLSRMFFAPLVRYIPAGMRLTGNPKIKSGYSVKIQQVILFQILNPNERSPPVVRKFKACHKSKSFNHENKMVTLRNRSKKPLHLRASPECFCDCGASLECDAPMPLGNWITPETSEQPNKAAQDRRTPKSGPSA